MKRILDNNRGNMNFTESLALKVVSLLLALILWITILGFKREELKKAVKLEPMLPPGKVLVGRIPSQVVFTFVGPRVILKNVEKHLQPIQIDLRNFRENTKQVIISEEFLVGLMEGVKVVQIQPASFTVVMEDVVEKSVNVRPIINTPAADGWELVSAKATPAKVSVSGPRGIIENLESVNTEPISIRDLAGPSATREVTLEVDSNQGLELSRQKVVSVRIQAKKINNK